MLQTQVDAFLAQGVHHDLGGIGVFLRQQPVAALDLNHLAAQPLEGLREFATNRATTQDQQPPGLFAQAPDGVGVVGIGLLQTGNRRHEGAGAGGDDDIARGQGLAVDFHFPGGLDGRGALMHFHTQICIALHRIVRLDIANHALDTVHHPRKVHAGAGLVVTQGMGAVDLCSQLGRTDQGLGGYAAGVQAVAAHGVLLDQADVGLDRRSNVRADQATATGADHHQIAIELFGFVPALVHLPRLDHVDDLARDQWEQAKEDKGTDQIRGENATQGLDLAQLAAGVHVDKGARQHPDLADPPEGARLDPRQAHGQVDHKERKGRHQAQGKEVERALALHALIDRLEFAAETLLYPVAQQKAADQHRQRRAQGRGEGDNQKAPADAEQGAAEQRHQGRPGQGQGRYQYVDAKEQTAGQPGVGADQIVQRLLACLDFLEAEILVQIEQEEPRNQRGDDE